jgi:hypothetical protein
MGCKGTFIGAGDKKAFEPDYGDPFFLEHLAAFMAEMGRKYNKDPRLEFIDIGTYGTWGEGHTIFGSERVWPADVIICHINMHLINFPDKFVLLNDDHITERKFSSYDESQRLLDYAVGKGLGLRDDSICVDSYCEKFGYNTLCTQWLFDGFWKNAPVDIELAHYTAIKDHELKACFPFLQSLMDTHATYSGFHGYPRPWLEKNRYFTEYAANRLGYWYFINGIEFTQIVSGLPVYITFDIENNGFAPCYAKYDAKLRLRNIRSGDTYYIKLNIDNHQWYPGRFRERVKVSIPAIRPGDYLLSLGLFEGKNPIYLGLTDKCFDGEYYDLCTASVNDIKKY